MKWLRNLLGIKPRIGKRQPVTNLTLEIWRDTPELVTAMANIQAMPIWNALIEMLKNESPSEIKLPQLGTSTEDRAALQCHIEGYHMAINNLLAVGTPVVQEIEPAATFEPEEQPTE